VEESDVECGGVRGGGRLGGEVWRAVGEGGGRLKRGKGREEEGS